MDEDVQSTAGRRTGHCNCDGGSEGTGKLRSIAGGSASDPLSSRQHSAEEHTASEERSICMCMLSDREREIERGLVWFEHKTTIVLSHPAKV